MRSIVLALSLLAGLSSLSSCRSVTYDGEWSKDGYYEQPRNVFFELDREANDQEYRLGTMPLAQTEVTLDFPLVHLSGPSSSSPLKYRIVVDPASTAKEGVHFAKLPEYFELPADSIRGSFPITVLRSAFDTDGDKAETLELILRLESTTDLRAKYGQSSTLRIRLSNYIKEPEWWENFQTLFGPFTAAKYIKLLEDYDNDENKLVELLSAGDEDAFFLLFRSMKKVKDYFDALPTATEADKVPDALLDQLP